MPNSTYHFDFVPLKDVRICLWFLLLEKLCLFI